MSAKHFREARVALVDLGFILIKTKGDTETYSHPKLRDRPPVKIYYGITDTQSGHLIENCTRHLGEVPRPGERKRNATQVKERQKGDRKRAADEESRHRLELADLIAQRDRGLGGVSGALSRAESRDIERLIEAKERELRYWRSLMTETPSSGHEGMKHAAHRS